MNGGEGGKKAQGYQYYNVAEGPLAILETRRGSGGAWVVVINYGQQFT
jgi:hypothetical protein